MNVREKGLSEVQRAAISFAEILAAEKIEEVNAQGVEECEAICRKAGQATAQAIRSMGFGR